MPCSLSDSEGEAFEHHVSLLTLDEGHDNVHRTPVVGIELVAGHEEDGSQLNLNVTLICRGRRPSASGREPFKLTIVHREDPSFSLVGDL